MCASGSRVALDPLLKCLGRLIQLPSYVHIVGSADRQLFPLAGMFPQLECLGEVLAAPLYLAEAGVVHANLVVAHGEIRIKLDGTLIVRQGRSNGAFLVVGLVSKAERFQ